MPAPQPHVQPPPTQVRKRVFLRHCILKTIILARQARDKHREMLRGKAFCAGRLEGDCDGTPGATCTYASCDNGYHLVAVPLAQEASGPDVASSDGLLPIEDAPLSPQAADPVGGPVWLPDPSPAAGGDRTADQGRAPAPAPGIQVDDYRQFAPCAYSGPCSP